MRRKPTKRSALQLAEPSVRVVIDWSEDESDDEICYSIPNKRRRLMAVQLPQAKSLDDLLLDFNARSSPNSASRDRMLNRAMRPTKHIAYAEATSLSSSPGSSQSASDFEATLPEPSQNESPSEDDIIHVKPRPQSLRKQPARSTRSHPTYPNPKLPKVPKKKANAGKKAVRLTSDLDSSKKTAMPKLLLSDRAKVHDGISGTTKPKRNAFILSKHEYFLPLLPDSSYVHKLLHSRTKSPSSDAVTVPYSLVAQPKKVLATMKPYQIEGLSFLVYMYRNGMSAILGDEMGLGKTLQTLALFQYLKEHEPMVGQNRPFLVVCPLSVLSSWMNEAKRWVPHLNTFRFHGPKLEREKLKTNSRSDNHFAKNMDILLTTYETFAAEENWFKRAYVWRYCVLDEGHKVKNDKSQISAALQGLNAEYRLLLTGTPLQNNLVEMWSLLHWLYPEVFAANTADKFKQAFDLTRGKVSTEFMGDARRLLELIMLRRMKHTCGVDLGLPPKEQITLYVPLTPLQRFWYSRFLTKTDNALLDDLFKDAKGKEVARKSTVPESDSFHDAWAESKEILEQTVQNESNEKASGDWRKLMNLIMQLRKVCSHPYTIPHAEPNPYYIGEHVKTASGKFIVLDKLIDELVVKQRRKIIIFSQFATTLNLCEDLLELITSNTAAIGDRFSYLRFDGGTVRARRNLGIRMFNDMRSEYRIMLISTRAGGLGINLTAASDVVFMDEDWNPQVTLQAEARAHRIGQTKKVTVYKLCTQGTVEEQMLGRIYKKLYLSTKITESMRNIHCGSETEQKRKRGPQSSALDDDDGLHLSTGSLMSIVRRGAQTLVTPQTNVKEMLTWDWNTVVRKCTVESSASSANDNHDSGSEEDLEHSWLNSMEKVETAVFEGKRHHKEMEKAGKTSEVLDRAARRIGKNTTVMVDGYEINKESMACADWEAVPTMAGKDPRLAEPVKIKKESIISQDHCQSCWEGGELVCCAGCPRTYHFDCLPKEYKARTKSRSRQFYCPQHECADCQSKTTEAGGMLYRCRWCENAFCEDCQDWERVSLIGETLPEFEMLNYGVRAQAWYTACAACTERMSVDKTFARQVQTHEKDIQKGYRAFIGESTPIKFDPDFARSSHKMGVDSTTPETVSEICTPVEKDPLPQSKKRKSLNTEWLDKTLGSLFKKKRWA